VVSGVVLFTKCLINQAEITQGPCECTAGLTEATDAAAAAAWDVNGAALNRDGLLELARQNHNKA
jgi:hypothetical protein